MSGPTESAPGFTSRQAPPRRALGPSCLLTPPPPRPSPGRPRCPLLPCQRGRSRAGTRLPRPGPQEVLLYLLDSGVHPGLTAGQPGDQVKWPEISLSPSCNPGLCLLPCPNQAQVHPGSKSQGELDQKAVERLPPASERSGISPRKWDPLDTQGFREQLASLALGGGPAETQDDGRGNRRPPGRGRSASRAAPWVPGGWCDLSDAISALQQLVYTEGPLATRPRGERRATDA
ncbi:unnamed protein product [Rangifer tarandus platyrhynchus]|uniref:Uncharacterized protein n=1 Tax=Rangifer tarandus platyrhynchus TaxID=3082113 RepID=A0AC59Z474_RANTA